MVTRYINGNGRFGVTSMKKWLAGITLILIAVIYWFTRAKPIQIDAVQVGYGEVRETVANTRSGSVKACRRSNLSVPIGGQIDQVLVHEGDKVVTGQLLLTLFNQDVHAQLAQAEAQLKAVDLQQDRQCIMAQSDRREAARRQALLSKGLSTAEQVDVANATADASAAACQASIADVEQAKAQVQLTEAILLKTQLSAPFAGTVAEVNGEVGEFATPSPPGILTLPMIDLIDDSCFYVSAPIDEVDAAQLKQDMKVVIRLDAFRDQPIQGTIRRIAPYVFAAEKQARTVEVEADINSDALNNLLVGYSADVEILIQAHQQVLHIPTEAIFDNNKVYVFSDDRLHIRQITTGLSNWQNTEVTSGLKEGEWVLTSASQSDLAEGVLATRK